MYETCLIFDIILVMFSSRVNDGNNGGIKEELLREFRRHRGYKSESCRRITINL